ncbi:MAG: S46 family peptidase, partial [Bacteroidia bacterium]
MIKKITLAFLIFNFSFLIFAKADEGMWLPLLLKQLNESDMQKNGLKLSAEDIYSINKSSLKDAIVQFNGGCTAEVISDKGLILTNHHCGYGQIQAHSTVQNDLLTNGFWAMNQSEELPNSGVTATFIVRMEDVTAKAMHGLKAGMTEAERLKIVAQNSEL